MKTVLLLFTIIALSYTYPSSHIFPSEWHSFKLEHGKSYKNLFEEYFRMRIFLDNKKKIEEHNAKYEQGHVSYKMKMNHLGDMMSHEFKALMNGLNTSSNILRSGELYVPSNDNLPASVDWRQKGAVTPVKNQGQCRSCWSFSATGSLEGQLFLKKGKLVSLSEQNLVDCSKNYENYGCLGGYIDHAFQYIKDNDGINTEDSYPYEATEEQCRFKKDKVGATVKGYVDIPSGDENALKDAVATVGPISVTIDSAHHSFQFYSIGVYSEPNCNNPHLDHALLVVGYGSENGQDYWLVKNSWGPSWGESGYIKMIRNKNNNCSIASRASYPLV